jgi:hypothetical protein
MRKGEMLPNTMMDDLRENFGDRVVTRAAYQIATEVGGGIQQSRQLFSRRGVLWPSAAAAAASPLANPAIPGNPEGQFPHVYLPADGSTLCLFDAQEDEWTPAMAIADTTLPWALDWLACYELWLMTGRWAGGGRHATPRRADAEETTR